MNTMYVMSGKGQSALQGASWAASSASNGEQTYAQTAADTDAPEVAENGERLSEKARNRGPEVQEAKLTFDDFIDIINPLQHIPLVNMAYRAITGDKISGFAQVAGGALYGGAIGIVSGVIDAVVQEQTGRNTGEVVVAALMGNDTVNPAGTMPSGESPDVMIAQADEQEDGESDMQVADAAETALPAPALPVESRPLVADAASVPAKKQPFGGIMDTDIAAAAKAGAPNVRETAVAAAPAAAEPSALPTAAPVNALNGQKFFSLANATRMGEGQIIRMPTKDSPDVRLKPINQQGYGITRPSAVAAADESVAGIPLVPKAQAEKVLGVNAANNDAIATAAATSPAARGSDPVPQALIEDMMRGALEKYQKGLSTGEFNKPSVDING